MNDTTNRTDAQAAAPQPGRLSTWLAGLIVLLIFLMPAAGFWWLRGMSREALERNRLAHARDMLYRHYVRTRGQWPKSWDDLAEDFEPADAGYNTPSLDVMRQLIDIDFTFDVSSLDAPRNPGPPPRVLRLKNRADTAAVTSANSHLMDALRQRIDSQRREESDR